MRLFQNSGIYRSYRPRLTRLTRACRSFDEALAAFLDDRYGTAHFLKPVLDRDPSAFFANGDDEFSQRLWAREHGMGRSATLSEILLAQIEEHRTEIFYNMDPMRYGDEFLLRLPACVKRTVAWRAAPSQGGTFLKHDIIVNNFPSLLIAYRSEGARAEYLAPAHDPALDKYAANDDRPTDVLFVGTYSRYHRGRAIVLEAVAALRTEMNVAFCLDQSRLTKLAETPLGVIGPLAKFRRSKDIRMVSRPPVFGRDLLSEIGRAKIVVNGAIDMANNDRGNMRVWEAMGCGAALISDAGRYPEFMSSPDHLLTYNSVDEAVSSIRDLLLDPSTCRALGAAGHAMISDRYSKPQQWRQFVEIVA